MKYKHACDKECYTIDFLSIARTRMANERTLLAYISTSLGFLATGVAFVKFASDITVERIGYILFLCALLIFICGFNRFHKFRKLINTQTCTYQDTLCTKEEKLARKGQRPDNTRVSEAKSIDEND